MCTIVLTSFLLLGKKRDQRTRRENKRSEREECREFVNGINNVGQIWKQRGEVILVTKCAPCSALDITMPRHIVFEGPDIFYLTRLMYTGNSCSEIPSMYLDITFSPLFLPLNFSQMYVVSFSFLFFRLYRAILVIKTMAYISRIVRDVRKL